MLLAGRILPGSEWIEVLALACWAAWLTPRLLSPKTSHRWRRRLWLIFSLVFFAQLGLALLGVEICQMTPDKLHFPIPALLVAGPVYRGGGFFMLGLFATSIILVGPAWCSHLCYLGAFDNLSADRHKKPIPLPHHRELIRVGIVVAVIGMAAGLRWSGAPGVIAGAAALAFGLLGIAIMLLISRARGTMVHCVIYCPVGLFAAYLGKLSPFRLRITADCTDCLACTRVCRYDALNIADIEARRPATSCTLCGDCLRTCKPDALAFRFGPWPARTAFVVIVVALHAVSLGLARI